METRGKGMRWERMGHGRMGHEAGMNETVKNGTRGEDECDSEEWGTGPG